MPQEQEQKKTQKRSGGGSDDDAGQVSSATKGEKLKEEMDDILDEIDSVLEETPSSSTGRTSRRAANHRRTAVPARTIGRSDRREPQLLRSRAAKPSRDAAVDPRHL